VYEAQTLEDAVALSTWEIRWQAALLAGLSVLAVALAMVGLYGVVAFAVSQRTREIGVRLALGATRQDVHWMVLGHGLRIAMVGVIVGTLISVAAMPMLRHYLNGIGILDAASLGAAALLWIVVAMLASWYPARRATRVDPATALRYE
jgi:ABC-type antimicrobial peptide transport system permease subunit